MSTILPEEPVVTDRESVILSNAERRYLRRKLKDSLAVTRDVLNPRNQLRRFVERQTTQAKQIADETVQIAKNNAPIVGVIGVSALLIATCGPISRWISRLRHSKTKTPTSK
ncbi:hypothetical protein [Sphingorhabdus sp.]|jgi:hypothetical protein|uniref:hypothetical protein n=1 Tax=Sphingorhabdus sp. TaxID=1902408 RepID=UPI0037CA34E1